MTSTTTLPETMRHQWRVFERRVREQLAQEGARASEIDAAMPRAQATYLANAQRPAYLGVGSLNAAITETVRYVYEVARGLWMELLSLQLELARSGPPVGGWPGLPVELVPTSPVGTAALPSPMQREWGAFCASLHAAASEYTSAEVTGTLATVAHLWPELTRELPVLNAPSIDGEAVLRHVNRWALAKQLPLLVAIVRAEIDLTARGATTASRRSEPARLAVVLPFSPRDKPG